MSAALDAVARAALAVEDAELTRRAAVVDAKAAGEDVTAIATAAGVGRQTVYRWIAMESGEVGGSPTAILRAAIVMLAGKVEPYVADQLLRRANGDTAMQLRALHIGRAAITPQSAQEMTDEDRAILGMATVVENRQSQGGGQ